jgi:predicted phosphodiesterase
LKGYILEKQTEKIIDGNLVSEITGYWDAVTKDNEGNAHIHRLEKHSTKVRPEFVKDINDVLIRQSKPTRITPSRRIKPNRPEQLTIAIPDAQIPFHDERALKLAHLAVRELMPDNIVLLGDMIDFPTLSRFEQRPEWSGQVQDSLDKTHAMLAQFRADAPDSNMYYLFGNHEQRLQKHMIKNNAELLGIKRANASKELGVMTLEFLLRMGELEVEAVGGYPHGELWLEDHTVFVHGTIAKPNQSTSIEYLKLNPYVNTVHGHSHRAEIQWRTTPTSWGNEQRFATSAGTLADIKGSVPSYHNTIDEQGLVVNRAENWQQGVNIISHNYQRANPELAMIQDGQIMIQGKSYAIT